MHNEVNFINRYGLILGIIKFKEWSRTNIKSLLTGVVSKVEKEVLEKVREKYPDIKTQFKIDKCYFDMCVGNKVIEVDGDYWHCNPRKYRNGDVMR